MPNRAAINPVGSKRNNISNRSVMNSFDGFNIARPMPALSSSSHLKILLLRFLAGGINYTDTWPIHSYGLLHENIFTRVDARFEVRRAKPRGRCEDGIVDPGNCQRLLIGIKPAEAFILGHTEIISRAGCLFRKQIGRG